MTFRKRILLFAAAASALSGQSFQGGVRGRIQDQSGAAINTAKVTLTDTGTNVSRSTLSNEQGEYVFNAVNPAGYSLTVESPGFKVATRGVTISTQTFLTVDIGLEVGNVTESVNVTEEVPLMETANASTGQVVDRQKLVDLPNLGRNPFMTSKIAQNVVPAGNPVYNRMQDQSGSSQISIAGGPVRGNNYLLDGVPITDSVNRAVIIPTIESVEEVKIQANTYDAEMGRTGGGVFNMYLKSGTNSLHGSGFGYMRQTEWAANTFFNNRGGLKRAEQPFRNYGGSIGGPVRLPKIYDGRNKTFFWIGAEAYRQTSALGSEFSVPTLAERTGNFSQSLSRTGATPAGGWAESMAGQLFQVAGALGRLRWEPLLMAVLVMGAATMSSKISPKLPAPLIGVLLACAVAFATGLHTRQVGKIALQIPEFVSFSWTPRDVISVLPSAIGLAFVSAANLLVTSRLVYHFLGDHKRQKRADHDRELGAYGIANVLTGMVGAPMSIGIPARSLANVRCGGRTMVSNLVHAALLALALYGGSTWIALVPVAALAGVTAWIGAYLLDWSTWRRLPLMRRIEAGAFLATVVGVQLWNPVIAVGLGTLIHFTPGLAAWFRSPGRTLLPESAGNRL